MFLNMRGARGSENLMSHSLTMEDSAERNPLKVMIPMPSHLPEPPACVRPSQSVVVVAIPSASTPSAAHCTVERRWPRMRRARMPTGMILKQAHSWNVGGSSRERAWKTRLFCTMNKVAGTV